MGSGLDDRPVRIGLPARGVDRSDVELAEVTGLRGRGIARRANVRGFAVDDADPEGWLAAPPWTPDRPALVLAEGVLTYLSPDDGKRLPRSICRPISPPRSWCAIRAATQASRTGGRALPGASAGRRTFPPRCPAWG
ncbi:class I SAM-dependent methyltransferase [Pleomorphomonas koreensis]|uniref:class I SAM-dependent methyltransferase n=1 Tax=Pleomorphomonas koreensis TaxID=257440 RepID=UPI000A04D738